MTTKVITLYDIQAGKTYDLGNKQYKVIDIKVLGIGLPDNTNKYFPPIVSPMNRIDLTGKFHTEVITKVDGNNGYYIQLMANNINTVISTQIQLDIDNQQVLDNVITLQISIQEI